MNQLRRKSPKAVHLFLFVWEQAFPPIAMRGKVTPPLPAIIVKPQCNYVYFYAWGLVSVRIFEEMGICRQLTVGLYQATFHKLSSV